MFIWISWQKRHQADGYQTSHIEKYDGGGACRVSA